MSNDHSSESIIRAAGTVSFFTVISRILGLVRDILSAVIFGSGMVWDSFVLAFTVPNLFRRIFGEGALTSAFLPVIVKVRKEKGQDKAGEITSGLVTLLAILLFVIAGVISAGSFIYFYKSGFSLNKNLTSPLLMVLIFYLPFICVSALLAAALNSVKHFAVPAFTPALLNIIWISALVVLFFLKIDLTAKAFILAGAVLLGGILQAGIQIPVLSKYGIRVRPEFRFRQPEIGDIFKRMLPVVLALVVMQINVLVDRLLAVTMIKGQGAVSALFYGNRLIQFPLAIFGIAVAVAVFPSLREFAVDNNISKVWSTLNLGIRILIFLIVPSAIGLITVGEPVVSLFFNWGKFAVSPDAARRVYFVLIAYSTGLLFFCFNILITKTFHSLDNRTFPARVAGLMVLVNLGLNLLFLMLTDLRETGLALSTSITALLNLIFLIVYLIRKYGFEDISGIVKVFIKTSLSACVMGAAVIVLVGYGDRGLIHWGSTVGGRLVRVVTGIFLGAGIYFICHAVLRTTELKELRILFKGKGKQ